MPWVKLTDNWYDDPAIVEAGDDGGWLWVTALSWSARNLTDGHVPSRQLSRLTTLTDPPTVAARLVDLGLFEVDAERGGWIVANYHRYQPTAAEVLAKREAEADRKRVRRVSDRNPSGQVAESDRNPSDVRPVSESPGPGPGPVPVGKPPSSSVTESGWYADATEDERAQVSAVLDLVADARLALAQSSAKPPVRASAWRSRCRANLDGEIGSDALAAVRTWDEPAHAIAEHLQGKRGARAMQRKVAP